jgi:phospholipase C
MAGLNSIEHVVVLMLENRSLDHMLGYLYTDQNNTSPAGQPFDGLTGAESNPDGNGGTVTVFPITPSTPNAYYMPGSDPGEGFKATNSQIFGTISPQSDATPTNQGFVTDYAYTLGWEGRENWPVASGTTANAIMGCYSAEALPVLYALARGYAVCDRWFGSVPTETLPNRAFAICGTSQGHLDDHTRTFSAPTIFTLLTRHGHDWRCYGYDALPLAKNTYTDITESPAANFGLFTDFTAAAAAGTLPEFTFIEPMWSSVGNSQHPPYDVALGEQLIHDVYYALRKGPGWNRTLFILTYDEHGGCYDHVAPPSGATPPDDTAGEYGFDFTRFGPRVPTLLISPLIPAGTVFRAAGGTLDHTSILKTVQTRWGLPALTARDAAAPDVGAAITLTTPRTDDPLAGVTVPVSTGTNPSANVPSHLQEIQADLISRANRQGAVLPTLHSRKDYENYIRKHR